MDEVKTMGEMENKEVRKDPRPPCHWCVEEKRKVPKLGILFMDLDGTGRRPVCGEHHDIARENGRRAAQAIIRDQTGSVMPA